MDLVRLNTLTRYWTQHPALHQMVQAYLGIKTEPPQPIESSNSADDLDEFMQMFSGFGGTTH